MRGRCPRFLFLLFVFLPSLAFGEAVRLDSSTQFLWGDDLLGEDQAVIAEHLRVGFKPEGKDFSVSGYARAWKDLSGGGVRDNDLLGRLYYLHLDYGITEKISARLGRQYVNLTAGSSVIDGLSLELRDLGHMGVTVTGGTEVKQSLDSEHSALGDYFFGMGLSLLKVKNTRFEASYARRYDEWDTAREEFGINARRFFKYISPYTELSYDRLSDSVNEAVLGVDITPVPDIFLKAEYYHFYPTFDSTSIYSVFSADEYREYLLRAEWDIIEPLTLLASYSRQIYADGDDEDAQSFRAGAKVRPVKRLLLNANIDRRTGWGGDLWGFEAYGDYSVKKLTASAGIEHDIYQRPDDSQDRNARRYWLGGSWQLRKNISVSARLEENINENFKHRTLGRMALNWSL
ncbi:MAG: hypothetical protein Q8J64_05610 [Thermodesulfovibrionales bacterium]|nr:hypothetical protein [Thermodesulfovibrionales bacterium]